MLYRAAAQLDTCTITASTPNTTPRSTFLPKFSDNNQHCHCPLAADCYVRAAAVYLSKLVSYAAECVSWFTYSLLS